MDEAKQGVYMGVSKGADFKNGLYFVLRVLLPLCFGMILVQGKPNLAISSGLNFRKYTPLRLGRGLALHQPLVATAGLYYFYAQYHISCRLYLWHLPAV